MKTNVTPHISLHLFSQIYKTHFDMLSKNYREYSSGTDPELKHILTRMFVLLCR